MSDTDKAKELILLAKKLLNTSDHESAYKAQNCLIRALESLEVERLELALA